MMMEGLSSLSGGADTWLTDKLDELERDGFVKFELN
jgi:DNA-binding HxlR family transcriptional regulator